MPRRSKPPYIFPITGVSATTSSIAGVGGSGVGQASGGAAAPSYNKVSVYDYLDTHGASYYKMDEASGNLILSGADSPDVQGDLRVTGTGSLTYNQTLSTYAGAPTAVQYPGTLRMINDTGIADNDFPQLVAKGDQTVGVIFNVNGTTLNDPAGTLFFSGGDVGSNSSSENTKIMFDIRGDSGNKLRVAHEYGSGTDVSYTLAGSHYSGENMAFVVRDATAKTYKFYDDNAGTVALLGTSSAYATNPTEATTGDRIVVGGRYHSASPILPSGFQIGLVFGVADVLDSSYLQTIVTKARDGASSGSIYFEANLS